MHVWSSVCCLFKHVPSPSISRTSSCRHENIRPETLKLVQIRAGNTLDAIGLGKDFLNRTPAAQ
jgi:hypothetical protein